MSDFPLTIGLHFFGAVTASVSHELKNRLAIINEQAGLLKDLVGIANRSGGHVDPERLNRLAESLAQQVLQGDGLLRHLNGFSHTVDLLDADADVATALGCVSALARRNADRRQARLSLQLPDSPLRVRVPSFWLMCLVWHLLEVVVDMDGPPQTLTLSCEKTDDAVAVRIAGEKFRPGIDEAVSALSTAAEALGVSVTTASGPPAVQVLFPA
jgi:C4-dicarboxylate-specific signal transduction histidine kinase